jgi:hypothetical protein
MGGEREDVSCFYLHLIANTNFGKIVQLYVLEEPILLFGEGEHRSLLETFLSEKNIPFEKVKLSDGEFGPAEVGKDESYRAVGMGLGVFNGQILRIIRPSHSEGYSGKGINDKHIEDVRPKLRESNISIV